MKTRKHILSMLMAVMMIFSVLLTPASAQETGSAEIASSQTASTLNEDYLGPVTAKDVIYQIITDRFYDGDSTNSVTGTADTPVYTWGSNYTG